MTELEDDFEESEIDIDLIDDDSGSEEDEDVDIVVDSDDSSQVKKRNMYFDNTAVEKLMNKYVERGCVDVYLRDEIMSHANELIRQIIRAHNFEYITPGRDQSSFNELFQVAWMQIEKTLYKYDNSPGSSKLFNMWSQIAKTRILAYLKKEKRDKKNMPSYRDFMMRRHKTKSKSIEDFEIFIDELEQFFQYDEEYLDLVAAMKNLWVKDDKPYDALRTKLKIESNKDINMVNQFLKIIRLNRDEFSINVFEIKNFDNEDEGYFYTDHDE